VHLDWKSGSLANGLECFRVGQFFDAHEHWECVWLTLREPEKSFLQSLIQITAALHHLEAGNRRGAASLLCRALKRLEHCPAVFGGIEVAQLRMEIKEWLQAIEANLNLRDSAYPRIRPVIALLK
jgi:uncharacterized protein